MATKLDKPLKRELGVAGLNASLARLGAQTLVLTGVAGNFCVLFTAHDAYMRDYRLVVPRDCVASQSEADTQPSGEIDFAAWEG